MNALPILPVTDDRDTGEFFAAAREHRLALRRCLDCGTFLHIPRAYCYHCGSWNTEWQDVDGAGTAYGWTIIERQTHPAFPVPYTVVLVDIIAAPGVRLVAHLPGRYDITVGQPMELYFQPVAEDVVLPNWRPGRYS
jgi:uncharacterized OB-fold protein